MNTPTHILIGAAVFARPNALVVTLAALLGGLVPDLSLFLMSGWSLFIAGIPPQTVFGELYFSPSWQQVFSVDNSLVLWGLVLMLALWRKSDWAIALTGAAGLHIVADFLLHNDDARPNFWPVTDWVFYSPVSYWDPAHYGNIVAPLEAALALILSYVLWTRFTGPKARAVIAVVAVVQFLPFAMWAVLFTTGGALAH